MKVFYKSKLAKAITFIEGFRTIMLLGMVFTEHASLSKAVLTHEEVHVKQYADCFALGAAASIVLMFVLFGLDVRSWWMLMLLLIPLLLYYVIYGAEYVYYRCLGMDGTDAYRSVGFERQAYWIQETWNQPCEKQREYVTFGWWGEMEGYYK